MTKFNDYIHLCSCKMNMTRNDLHNPLLIWPLCLMPRHSHSLLPLTFTSHSMVISQYIDNGVIMEKVR